jgi:hypothetical protein
LPHDEHNTQPFETLATLATEADDIPSFPPYIIPMPQSWHNQDVEFLVRKGVPTIPAPELLKDLLRSYVEWVHPLCPVLDLPDFLGAMAQPDGSKGRVSLLVLYAVFLAGAAFVPERVLTTNGYSSRLAARKDFFFKAKVGFPRTMNQPDLLMKQSATLLIRLRQRSSAYCSVLVTYVVLARDT